MEGLLLTRWLTSLAVVALLCLALGGGCRAGRDPPLSFCLVWVGKVPPGLAGALQLGWSLRDCPAVLSSRGSRRTPSATLRSDRRREVSCRSSLRSRPANLRSSAPQKSAPQPARAGLWGGSGWGAASDGVAADRQALGWTRSLRGDLNPRVNPHCQQPAFETYIPQSPRQPLSGERFSATGLSAATMLRLRARSPWRQINAIR